MINQNKKREHYTKKDVKGQTWIEETENGMRIIASLDFWTDIIFSAEMDNAIKLGYKF